jgi:hypothetical protein
MLKSLDDFCTIFKTIFSHKDLPNVDVDDLFFFKLKVVQMCLQNVLMSLIEILVFVKSVHCYAY